VKLSSGHSYQDFFTLWKDAEPDISILKQAKAEYAKLQRLLLEGTILGRQRDCQRFWATDGLLLPNPVR